MGITIHYSGRVRDNATLNRLMNEVMLFAAERDWPCAMFEDPLGEHEEREDQGLPPDLERPYKGIVVRPHPKSESIRLIFNIELKVEAFTKTQFAPFAIHVEVVSLLKQISPLFSELSVLDEAGLWETGDRAAAEAHFEHNAHLIDRVTEALKSGEIELGEPDDDSSPYDIAVERGEADDELPPDKRPYG